MEPLKEINVVQRASSLKDKAPFSLRGISHEFKFNSKSIYTRTLQRIRNNSYLNLSIRNPNIKEKKCKVRATGCSGEGRTFSDQHFSNLNFSIEKSNPKTFRTWK